MVAVGLYYETFFLSGENSKPFVHLSVGKACPFTLESHIHVKALKMQGFPNN